MAADRLLLGRFWRFVQPHQRWLWVSVVLMPVAALCQLAGPLIVKYAIDEHLLPGRAELLRWDALAFLGVLLGEYAARAGERFAVMRCGVLTLQDVRSALMAHVTAQPVSLFERRPLGALVSRITSDVEALMETLSMGVSTVFSDALTMVGILLVMAWLHVRLTLVTVVVALPLVVVIDIYRKQLRASYDRIRRHTGRLHGTLSETIGGVRELQLFGYQERMQARFAAANDAYFRDNMRVVAFDATLYSVVEAMGILTIALMAWYGSHLVISGVVTIGVLVAFIQYIQRFYTPIKELSSKLAVLQGGFAALDRVFGLLDQDERQPWGTRPAAGLRPHVAFEGVWFAYPRRVDDWRRQRGVEVPASPEEEASESVALEQLLSSSVDRPADVAPAGRVGRPAGQGGPAADGVFAVRNVSLTVGAGERIAVVGATGSGKSTLVKLLAGVYRPLRGRVTVGGRPVNDYRREAFQRRVGIVHQDVHLFADTIAFNIGLGDPRVSRRQIVEACRIVQADAFIQHLPRGYDSVLPEGGRNLSQGQRQLLAFARVLAWSPDLVMLDEATSAVDSHSEQLIQAAILEVLQRKTTIVIAHRLTTILHVDRVLVLHSGAIVEAGAHRELLERRGFYHGLFEAQFAIR